MTYYTGVATNISDLKSALLAACTANGWTYYSPDNTVHKGTMFFKLVVNGVHLELSGLTAIGVGSTPHPVRIGQIMQTTRNATYYGNITYPASYHAFVFDNEVYFIVNYGTIYYQFLMFGKTLVAGLDPAASGNYVSGTYGTWGFASVSLPGPVSIKSTGNLSGGEWYGSCCPAPFWSGNMDEYAATSGYPGQTNYYVHHNLDGHGWMNSDNGLFPASNHPGIQYISNLIAASPNTFNSESVLFPIRSYKKRPSTKCSLVLELEKARFCRVDNIDPGQIITLGADQWMVFPFYKKDIPNRNGTANLFADHSGTFGWAIRYN